MSLQPDKVDEFFRDAKLLIADAIQASARTENSVSRLLRSYLRVEDEVGKALFEKMRLPSLIETFKSVASAKQLQPELSKFLTPYLDHAKTLHLYRNCFAHCDWSVIDGETRLVAFGYFERRSMGEVRYSLDDLRIITSAMTRVDMILSFSRPWFHDEFPTLKDTSEFSASYLTIRQLPKSPHQQLEIQNPKKRKSDKTVSKAIKQPQK